MQKLQTKRRKYALQDVGSCSSTFRAAVSIKKEEEEKMKSKKKNYENK